MKDPLNALRTAYYEHLQGVILLNGVVVEVFADNVPQGITRPYVFIGDSTVSQRDTGRCPSYDTTTLVQVVTHYHPTAVQGSEVHLIAAQVSFRMSNISGWKQHLNSEFDVASHRLESNNGLTDNDGQHFVNRRLLRFRDIVFEL